MNLIKDSSPLRDTSTTYDIKVRHDVKMLNNEKNALCHSERGSAISDCLISRAGQHPDQLRHLLHQNAINNGTGNPRLPPYPHPTTILPLVQIKQTLSIPGLSVPGARTATTSKSNPSLAPPGGCAQCLCVAVCFAASRGWVAGSPNVTRDKPGWCFR